MSYPKMTAFEQFLFENKEINISKDKIEYYIGLEKEQIENAFNKGQFFSVDYFKEVEGMEEAEAYYHKEYVEPKLIEQRIAEHNRKQREKWLKSKENEQNS
jgi:hypothetical protein